MCSSPVSFGHHFSVTWVSSLNLFVKNKWKRDPTRGKSPLSGAPTFDLSLSMESHPTSVMPLMNSSRVNSHCVAALNFQAMMRTTWLSGFKLKSSRNFSMPSAVIFSSSWGSLYLRVRRVVGNTHNRMSRASCTCTCFRFYAQSSLSRICTGRI